jgi:hypothetical protein
MAEEIEWVSPGVWGQCQKWFLFTRTHFAVYVFKMLSN